MNKNDGGNLPQNLKVLLNCLFYLNLALRALSYLYNTSQCLTDKILISFENKDAWQIESTHFLAFQLHI